MAVSALVVLVLVGALSLRLFAFPSGTGTPDRADAIVVLAGGGRRADRGVELAAAGVASTVVFTTSWVPAQAVYAVPYCNSPEMPVPDPLEFEVICLVPEPATTRGEVRQVATLARERGWDEVVFVTSTDQVTRARMLLDRCWDGQAWFSDVTHSHPLPVRVVYEWAAMTKALIDRDC